MLLVYSLGTMKKLQIHAFFNVKNTITSCSGPKYITLLLVGFLSSLASAGELGADPAGYVGVGVTAEFSQDPSSDTKPSSENPLALPKAIPIANGSLLSPVGGETVFAERNRSRSDIRQPDPSVQVGPGGLLGVPVYRDVFGNYARIRSRPMPRQLQNPYGGPHALYMPQTYVDGGGFKPRLADDPSRKTNP